MRAAKEVEVISALQAGDRIMMTLPDPMKISEKTTYSLVGSGRRVNPSTFRRLRDSLRPERDGLFEDGLSQSFCWAG